jgi:hypothetical protein
MLWKGYATSKACLAETNVKPAFVSAAAVSLSEDT